MQSVSSIGLLNTENMKSGTYLSATFLPWKCRADIWRLWFPTSHAQKSVKFWSVFIFLWECQFNSLFFAQWEFSFDSTASYPQYELFQQNKTSFQRRQLLLDGVFWSVLTSLNRNSTFDPSGRQLSNQIIRFSTPEAVLSRGCALNIRFNNQTAPERLTSSVSWMKSR